MINKKGITDLINKYEKAIIDLSNWSVGDNLVLSEFGHIKDINHRDITIANIENFISKLEEEKREDDSKLYLSEIIELEKPEFGENNLIVSPVGSGKTHFMRTLIEKGDNILLLVSTTSLKSKFIPNDEKKRMEIKNRMYSTKMKEIYGDNSYKILVMTYSEFGEKIKYVDKFAEKFTKIFCDEIHSLPLYQGYTDSSGLLVAIHYLFRNHKEQPKYYFTATEEHIEELNRKSEGAMMSGILKFDYMDHPDIKRHIPLASYKIHGIEQIRPHLKARKKSFKYFNYKVFAFCKTIESQLRLKKICEEEGFSAEAYWSIHNEDKPMTESQIKEVEYMINEEKLPDKYDVIIVNSSLQEGWDLKDSRVKLAIMNTTNETEYTQALGRLRQDIDVLVYKVKKDEESDIYIDFPHEFIDQPLDVETREKLRSDFDIRDRQGRIVSWKTIIEILEKQGFTVINKQVIVNGKRKRITTVHAR